jgi:hypothetical protein
MYTLEGKRRLLRGMRIHITEHVKLKKYILFLDKFNVFNSRYGLCRAYNLSYYTNAFEVKAGRKLHVG